MNNSTPTFVTVISEITPWLISNEMYATVLGPSIESIIISIALIGLITNFINCIVFMRMGLKSSTNICFFSLAIADYISACWIFFLYVNFHIDWSGSLVSVYALRRLMPFYTLAVSAFGSWMTAIIALERWCCVAFPLKVKTIFTRRSVTVMVIVAAVYEIGSIIPTPFVFTFTPIRLPGTNRTQLGVDPNYQNQNLVLENNIKIASFAGPSLICFSLVSIATIFLIRGLQASLSLRESMTGKKSNKSGGESKTGNKSSKELKEARIAKTVVMICIIYITGYFINTIKYPIDLIYPGIHPLNPYYGNFVKLLTAISYLLQAFSCSANIFVYLKMNSQYMTVFMSTFLYCFQH